MINFKDVFDIFSGSSQELSVSEYEEYRKTHRKCAICGKKAEIIGHNELTWDIRKIHWCGDCWGVYIRLDLSLDKNLTSFEKFSLIRTLINKVQKGLSVDNCESRYVAIKQMEYYCGDIVEINRFSPGYLKGIPKKIGLFGSGYCNEIDFYMTLTNFMGGFGLSKFLVGLTTSFYMSCLKDKQLLRSRKKNQNRQKSRIRRVCNRNISSAIKERSSFFYTLTFEEDVSEEFASRELCNFVKRIKYHNPGTFDRYIWVKERTEKGRIHYHLIVFDWKYYPIFDFYEYNNIRFETRYNHYRDGFGVWRRGDKLQDAQEELERYLGRKLTEKEEKSLLCKGLQSIWCNGFVWLERTRHVQNVGAYVSKYLGKTVDFKRKAKLYSISHKCIKYVIKNYPVWKSNPDGKVLKQYSKLNCDFKRKLGYQPLITRLYKSTTILLN